MNVPKSDTANEGTVIGRNEDLKGDLFDASCVLESVIVLLRHYDNKLADDTATSWYGLSLILAGIHQTLLHAHEAQGRLNRS